MKGFTKLIFFILLSLFWTFGTRAELHSVDGEGRFYSRDDDSLTFIKKQLLISAFRDVFTKELKSMGLDADKFWRRYEDKFAEYIEPIKTTMEGRYGIGVEGKQEKKADFQKAWRTKKLGLKSRYGRLSRAIPQYSIKKMSRSPQVPNSRYLRLMAKVNRKELHRIYLQFTSDSPDRSFSTLYLTTHFDLVDASWLDTGVNLESDFTEVLVNHWREKLGKELEGKINKIVFTDSALESELRRYGMLSNQTRLSIEESMTAEAESEEGIEEGAVVKTNESVGLDNDFGSSIWLTMSFKLKKTKEYEESKKREFEISGDIILKDLGNQKTIVFEDFPEEIVAYSYQDPKTISTGLANKVFQMPLKKISTMDDAVHGVKGSIKKVELEVAGYNHIGELNSLIKLLSEKGITKQFSPMIKSFGVNNAKILLEYVGEDQGMLGLLRSLDNLSLGKSSQLSIPNPKNPLSLSIKGSGIEVDADEDEV